MDSYQRLLKLRAYIGANLDGDLGLARLSQWAHISPYHLHRQFCATFGFPPARLIARLRLRRASYQLAYRPALPITRIALKTGYASPEAFSRAFSRIVGQSPTAFRHSPDWERWEENLGDIAEQEPTKMYDSTTLRVEIVNFPALRVARLDHVGPPQLLGNTLRDFIQWRREQRLPPARSRTFNLVFDNPASVDPADYRLGLCAQTEKPVEPNGAGVLSDTIPAGRCARVRHTGPDAGLEPLVRRLYGQWLPASGEVLRDYPLFFERVSFYPDVAEPEMITDVFLPLA
ncbi:AraC family transcriptional regulator [Microbulbifer sediminum]|uniref:AraC family transcriptional regulator n=1 Tax=Microbulbifer sediminum TaxID=2904250 RepID=UPI001F2A3896|nr:AraC family transcriptional regulator [Microbulbifer sediminum]